MMNCRTIILKVAIKQMVRFTLQIARGIRPDGINIFQHLYSAEK